MGATCACVQSMLDNGEATYPERNKESMTTLNSNQNILEDKTAEPEPEEEITNAKGSKRKSRGKQAFGVKEVNVEEKKRELNQGKN